MHILVFMLIILIKHSNYRITCCDHRLRQIIARAFDKKLEAFNPNACLCELLCSARVSCKQKFLVNFLLQVKLPDMNVTAFLCVLEYLYTDEVSKSYDGSKVAAMAVANFFCLPRLVALYEKLIVEELEIDLSNSKNVMGGVVSSLHLRSRCALRKLHCFLTWNASVAGNKKLVHSCSKTWFHFRVSACRRHAQRDTTEGVGASITSLSTTRNWTQVCSTCFQRRRRGVWNVEGGLRCGTCWRMIGTTRRRWRNRCSARCRRNTSERHTTLSNA